MTLINLCKFKDIFGKPNQGAHSYRIFNIAIIDLIATIIGAYLFTYVFNIPFWFSFILFIVLAIFFHKIFCVDTTINKFIFG